MRVKHLKYVAPLCMVAFLSCVPSAKAILIDDSVVSENYSDRGGKLPQVLMLHCVGLSDEWVIQNYGKSKSNGGLGVSAHYYISQEKEGKIYRLVPEELTAFHAGPSGWRLSSGLNNTSIGIEFQSLGYAQVDGEGYYPYSFADYSEAQVTSGISICQSIMKDHDISPENVVWHSDVSPIRGGNIGKTDPGPRFPAKRFAENGIGVWPVSDRLEDDQLDLSLKAIQAGLKLWGYPDIDATGCFDQPTKYVLQSHYMHYLPQDIPWENYIRRQAGSVFDTVKDWEDFPYDKEKLAISLENLNNKNFAFKVQ